MSALSTKYDLSKLLSGPARLLYGKASGTGAVAIPTKLDDVVSLAAPYTAKTGWSEAGSTTDAPEWERDMDSSDFEIERSTGAVISRITSVTRTLTAVFSEVTPELTQIIEVSPSITTIAQGAASSGTPAQSRVPFGSINALPRYRWVLICERPAETSSAEGGARGQAVGLFLYSASVAADGSSMEFGKEDLTGRECGFQCYPDPTLSTPGTEHGAFLFESGATVP